MEWIRELKLKSCDWIEDYVVDLLEVKGKVNKERKKHLIILDRKGFLAQTMVSVILCSSFWSGCVLFTPDIEFV